MKKQYGVTCTITETNTSWTGTTGVNAIMDITLRQRLIRNGTAVGPPPTSSAAVTAAGAVATADGLWSSSGFIMTMMIVSMIGARW